MKILSEQNGPCHIYLVSRQGEKMKEVSEWNSNSYP